MISRIKIISLIIAMLVILHAANVIFLGGALYKFGLHPRNIDSIVGIVFSPFLHGNWAHLISNISGFAIFAFLTLLHGQRLFWQVSATVIVVGGLGVWLFGREANHVGASGWIFGLWAFCIAHAWFQRSLKSFLIALGVIVFWGGMVFGLLPTRSYISFEAHIFGAIAGIFAAAYLPKRHRLT